MNTLLNANNLYADMHEGNFAISFSVSRQGVLDITSKDTTKQRGAFRTVRLRRERMKEIIEFLNEALLFSMQAETHNKQ